MRHIILGLSLFIALPQPLQADNSSNFLYYLAAFGIVGVVNGVYQLVHEQKRKNDLLQDAIRQKKSRSTIDPISCFKTLEQASETNAAAVERLMALHRNNPELQQKCRDILEKGIRVHQEISDSLALVQQLNAEKRKQFGFILDQNITKEDLQLLVALKAREYRDIPRKVIDETKEAVDSECIALSGNSHIKISKQLLEKLKQQPAQAV